jgi:hypothetical protein
MFQAHIVDHGFSDLLPIRKCIPILNEGVNDNCVPKSCVSERRI